MSAYENRMRQAALSGIMGSYAGGLGNQAGAAMAGTASNMAQAMAMEEYQKEQEKKEKSGKLGKLGSIVGGVVGNAILPGIGGAALGSALGGTAGHMAGGSKFDLGTSLGYGAQGAIGGMMMPAGAAAGGAGNVLKQGVAQAPAMIAKPTPNTMATPQPSMTNPLPQVTQPVGTNSVLAPTNPAMNFTTSTPAPQPGRLGGFFSNPTSNWRSALTGAIAAHGGYGQMGSGIGQTPPPPGYAYNQNGELVPIGG